MDNLCVYHTATVLYSIPVARKRHETSQGIRAKVMSQQRVCSICLSHRQLSQTGRFPVKSSPATNHATESSSVGSPEAPPRPLREPVPALAAKLGPATPGPGLKGSRQVR